MNRNIEKQNNVTKKQTNQRYKNQVNVLEKKSRHDKQIAKHISKENKPIIKHWKKINIWKKKCKKERNLNHKMLDGR